MVAGFTRDTEPDFTFATQTEPSPTPTTKGPWPTSTVFQCNVPLTGRGSIRVSESVWPLTHTPPGPMARRTAPSGSDADASTVPLVGSMRLTAPATRLATQIPPSPAASDTGPCATGMG